MEINHQLVLVLVTLYLIPANLTFGISIWKSRDYWRFFFEFYIRFSMQKTDRIFEGSSYTVECQSTC